MHAYKFLDAHFGLKSLYERRLKQSRIDELNDPFELTPYDLTDLTLRKTFLQTRDDMHDRGMLCFSADWSNPVIWAHYSDKHKGLCLGFEIPDKHGDPANDEIDHVKYIEKPLQFPANYLSLPDPERFELVRIILFTKFKHWEYEKEIRVFDSLQNEENGLNFVTFGEKMLLTEVIIGRNCTLRRTQIAWALGPLTGEVKISRVRAAYDRFEMVEDEQGP